MKDKKGQVALEFMMTYGWAIIIMSVVALFLWQMGVFDVESQIEPGTSGFGVVSPYEDFTYTSAGVLKLPINNMHKANVTITKVEITIEGITYTLEDTSITDYITDNDATIPPGRIKVWDSETSSVTLPQQNGGSSYRLFLSFTYNDSRTEEEYMSSGWIWGNIEE